METLTRLSHENRLLYNTRKGMMFHVVPNTWQDTTADAIDRAVDVQGCSDNNGAKKVKQLLLVLGLLATSTGLFAEAPRQVRDGELMGWS